MVLKIKEMSNKILLPVLMMFSVTILNAQSTDNKMSDVQKTQAANADVYIVNSNKKITDSFNTTAKDTTAVTKKTKKKFWCKRNKKSS